MKNILGYLKNYLFSIDKRILVLSSLFVALFIFINYYFKLEKAVIRLPFEQKYTTWFFIFFIAFIFPYTLSFLFQKMSKYDWKFFALLLFAPALFAWKIAAPIHFDFNADETINKYWNLVAYWPFKLLIVGGCVGLIWKLLEKHQPFYGLSTRNIDAKPYLLLLLIMVPLVAAASLQKDFLAMYPKLKSIQFLLNDKNAGIYSLLYELSYGSDFLSIELFFRGFLILAFAKWAGKESILPMALFYCTIHFGKPLGECISSYFGGLILGVITYHTRSILGGLMVHLGIAWLMELCGYLGNLHTAGS